MTKRSEVELVAEAATLPRIRSVEEALAYWRPRWDESRRERVAECEANGAHVLTSYTAECPHCDTPYSEIES